MSGNAVTSARDVASSQRQLSVLILTFNEQVNLTAALESLEPLNADAFIVDSGSTDLTREIAGAWGCHVVEHPFVNHAEQLNWAIGSLPIRTPWVMRLDADERLTPELVQELAQTLQTLPDDVSGLEIKRRVYFWGRWIRHGGYYPVWLLRVWRAGRCRCEQRSMDEHMIVTSGRVVRLEHDFIDENHKGLAFWIEKHNSYADREVKDVLAIAAGESYERPAGHAGRRRQAKENVYARMPLFWRAFFYWFYRYFILLGILDGRPGFVFHFLQAWWYRTLVDAKLYELERNSQSSPVPAAANPKLLGKCEEGSRSA